MMKIYINRILLLSLGVFMLLSSSCSNSLLDEKLYSQLGTSSLPKGKDGVNQLVLGIYPYLQPIRYQAFALYASDVPSDQMFVNWGGTPETAWGGQQNFLFHDSNHAAANDTWQNSYKIIAQCNEAIKMFDEEAKTNEEVNQILAEARFWRAFFYNRLVRTYGYVPLVIGGEDFSGGIAQTEGKEVIQFVINELKSIENVLPTARPSEDYGRPTQWAVKAFMANVYLNEKDWINAGRYAKEVIDKGGFSLLPYYHDVFGIDENEEVILVSVAIGLHYRGNGFDAQCLEGNLNKALNIQGVSGSNGLGLAVTFFNSFDPKDERREDYNPATKKGIMIHGYINNPDGTPLHKDANGSPLKVEESLNRVIALKYPIQENPVSGEWMTQDMPILRLAEVYLIYAEAQNELGNSSEALEYVKRIRERAGLNSLSASLTKEQLRDAILDERGWELYTEGFRRDDLIRHGKLLEKVKSKWEYYLDTPWVLAGATYRNLFPVPSSAMIKNPLLKQNTGY